MKHLLLLPLICLSFLLAAQDTQSPILYPSIADSLGYWGILDQEYAGIPPEGMTWDEFRYLRDSVQRINTEKVKVIFDSLGYMGFKQVGEKASMDFWAIIQHSDRDRRKVLNVTSFTPV